MPGQVTHFYVAARIARDFTVSGSDDVMPIVRKGIRDWIAANNAFAKGADTANDPKTANGGDMLDRVMATYRLALMDSEDVAIFSAFAAGAIGPDLWTIPSNIGDGALSTFFGVPIDGSWYFDMGHYNSSHVFPAYTLKLLHDHYGDWATLQRRYRTAYILGYISHICTDIICHPLVNVFAGAYHQQKQKVWELEKNPAGGLIQKNIFNDHNKIEQFWDALVRYLCFEGYHADVAGLKPVRANDFGQPDDWNFPNYRDYWSKRLRSSINRISGGDKTFLNLSTSLPGPFAHLYKAKNERKVEPFIRDFFYDAYDKADDYFRADHQGSLHKDNVENELEKLEFFYLDPGTLWVTTQESYLDSTLPSLSRTIKKGPEFYDVSALGRFIQAAIVLGTSYVTRALAYLDSGNDEDLLFLHNWNLDIGSAIRIKQPVETDPPDPKKTLPVYIDLINVFDDPALAGFTLPSLSRAVWSKKFEAVSPAWNIPPLQPITPPQSVTTSETPIFTDTPLTVVLKPPIPLTLRLKQVCFYDQDTARDEIAACIFGSEEKKEEPWIIKNGYDIAKPKPDKPETSCAEDFKAASATTSFTDLTTLGKASRLFSTTFLGGTADFYTADGDSSATPSTIYANKPQRILPRHIRIAWCRKWTCTPNDDDEFEPDRHDHHETPFPSEEMVLSVFALHLLPSGAYRDLFYNTVSFTQEQVDSLKKIKVIGVNSVVLLFKANDQGTIRLFEAWIDGQKQIITQDKPADVPGTEPPEEP